MERVEKELNNYLYNGLNILRKYYDTAEAERLFIDVTFIKFFNETLRVNKEFSNYIGLDYIDTENEKSVPHRVLERYNGLIYSDYLTKLTKFNFEALFKNNNEYIADEFMSIVNNLDCSKIISDGGYGNAFSYLIDGIMKGNKLETRTPKSLSKLIGKIFEGKEVSTIYDPTIGTGSLVREIYLNHSEARIIGQDIYNQMVKISKMVLILDGKFEDAMNIYEGNTIVDPLNIRNNELEKYDCVVSNPSFSVKDWGYNQIINGDRFNRFHRGIPPKSNGDYAFITQLVESLKDNGVGAMILPSGVLFREGAEGAIREKLIGENIIDAVIAFPSNMLYGTTIPVTLVIFNKNKRTRDILFVDTTSDIEANKVLTVIKEETINKIVDIYNNRVEIEGFSKVVGEDIIEENKYNLSVMRYVEKVCEKEELDLREITNEIEDLKFKINEIQDEINKYL